MAPNNLARLDGQSLAVRQRHFDVMELSVWFEIGRIEAQIIDEVGRVGEAVEFGQKIVLGEGGAPVELARSPKISPWAATSKCLYCSTCCCVRTLDRLQP